MLSVADRRTYASAGAKFGPAALVTSPVIRIRPAQQSALVDYR
jgi:hypothetical protein